MSPACTASPESERLVRLREGDPEAYRALVERYHPSLVRLARSFVASHDVAEEVAQETWLAVMRGLEGFEGRSSLRTWIFRILANRARSRGVREARVLPFSSARRGPDEARVTVELDAFGPRARWIFQGRRHPAGSPEKASLDQEARDLVLRELRRLPPKQGAVVYLRDVCGWAADEVCAHMDISDVYQRVLLHRGRTRVRAELVEAHGLGNGRA